MGVFGPGWKAPSDIRLQLRDDALVLNDNGGRSIHFEPLLPGEAVYSRSESMWLVRGGKAAQPDGHTLARLWALPPDIRLSPHLYLATNSAQGPWWILGWSERVPGRQGRTASAAAAVPGAYRAGRPFRADADVPA